MKTIEEVKSHIRNVGYSDGARERICGYLVAKGLKDIKEKLSFKLGVRTFEDFVLWFDSEKEEHEYKSTDFICFGDCVHVQKGLDVVSLGCVYGDTFIGTDGVAVCPCKITKETRACNEDESETLFKRMEDENIAFDYETMSLAPLDKIDDCKLQSFICDFGIIADDEEDEEEDDEEWYLN